MPHVGMALPVASAMGLTLSYQAVKSKLMTAAVRWACFSWDFISGVSSFFSGVASLVVARFDPKVGLNVRPKTGPPLYWSIPCPSWDPFQPLRLRARPPWSLSPLCRQFHSVYFSLAFLVTNAKTIISADLLCDFSLIWDPLTI